MDWKADIIDLEWVETPEIPIEAIREAVINSYGHRMYNNNQCNEIDVLKDVLENQIIQLLTTNNRLNQNK